PVLRWKVGGGKPAHAARQGGERTLVEEIQAGADLVAKRREPARVEVSRTKERTQDRATGRAEAVGIVALRDLLAEAVIDRLRKPQRVDERAALLIDLAVGVLAVLAMDAGVAVEPVTRLRDLLQRVRDDVMEP